NASFLAFVGTIADSTSAIKNIETRSRANTIISTDTTWTLANSPYNFTGNILVEHNATLTINPGVEVKLSKDNYIQIEGKFIAEGIANKMITFTSIKTNPSKNDYWDSIKFMNNAKIGSSIKYCKINNANGAIYVDPENPTWAPYQNAPNITYCEISNCKNRINFDSRHPSIISLDYINKIEFNTISNGIQIYIQNANIFLGNNIIRRGIGCVLNGGKLKISNNSISGSNDGIYCSNSWISNLNITRNLIGGNSDSGIKIGTWANDGIDSINISNNTIFFNGKGIDFVGAPNKVNISNNTIRNNKYGILFPTGYSYFPSPPNYYQMNYNNIFNNSKYNVKNGVPKNWGDLNFKNNWWGTTNTNLINQSIYDFYDDFNLGKVIYNPFLTKEVKIFKPYNLPPVAEAGPNQSVLRWEEVYFDWSKSYDPNNMIVQFNLDFGDGNSTGWKDYFVPQSYNLTYHVYEKLGNFTVTLTVFDGFLYDTDSCWVNVSKLIIPNYPPSLHLPTVEIPEDSYLQQYYDLWEYAADDRTPDEWLNFSIVNITNPKCGVILESKRYITIKPSVNWHGNATVTLRVDDGELNSTFELKIIVYPVREPPMANAGGDLYVKLNQTVNFDGSGSKDSDGDILSYNWTFGDGTYTGWQNSSNTSHSYNKIGKYKVTLFVSDSEYLVSDTIYVRVYSNATNLQPIIFDIPDIFIHYYSPVMSYDYFGYNYNFSYFIHDPD
ncbi:MAG: PKD domain-containing protein, partial [Promethearchaeota archaeon]